MPLERNEEREREREREREEWVKKGEEGRERKRGYTGIHTGITAIRLKRLMHIDLYMLCTCTPCTYTCTVHVYLTVFE